MLQRNAQDRERRGEHAQKDVYLQKMSQTVLYGTKEQNVKRQHTDTTG